MGDIRRLHQLMPYAVRAMSEPELEVPKDEGRHPLDSGWIPLVAFVATAALTAIVLSSGLRLLPLSMMAHPIFAPAASFVPCVYVGQPDCVIDGATFRSGDDVVHLADIEAPAIAGAECRAEALRGERAMRRLMTLLNAGPFVLEPAATSAPGPRYHRVTRDGQSLGLMLVAEGFAARRGRTDGWC